MKKEDKELLIHELCARLPYGLIIYISASGRYKPSCREQKFTNFGYYYNCKGKRVPMANRYMLEHIKPYLRPMSSMTEEEKDTYDRMVMCNSSWVVDDWLNNKKFDYRGLIEKGLALKAPEDMYKD